MQSQPHAYNCFIKWFVNIFECWHSCNCHSLCHHKVWTIALKFIFCTFPMWKYFLFCPYNHMIVYTQWKSGKWYVLNDSDILFKYYKYICHYTHQKCISYNLKILFQHFLSLAIEFNNQLLLNAHDDVPEIVQKTVRICL